MNEPHILVRLLSRLNKIKLVNSPEYSNLLRNIYAYAKDFVTKSTEADSVISNIIGGFKSKRKQWDAINALKSGLENDKFKRSKKVLKSLKALEENILKVKDKDKERIADIRDFYKSKLFYSLPNKETTYAKRAVSKINKSTSKSKVKPMETEEKTVSFKNIVKEQEDKNTKNIKKEEIKQPKQETNQPKQEIKQEKVKPVENTKNRPKKQKMSIWPMITSGLLGSSLGLGGVYLYNRRKRQREYYDPYYYKGGMNYYG